MVQICSDVFPAPIFEMNLIIEPNGLQSNKKGNRNFSYKVFVQSTYVLSAYLVPRMTVYISNLRNEVISNTEGA